MKEPGTKSVPDAVATIIEDARAEIEQLYGSGLVRLVLFGSHARGDATAASDVDLLVVLRGDPDPVEELSRMSASMSAISLRYDVTISCAVVAERRFLTEKSPFLINVRREGIAA